MYDDELIRPWFEHLVLGIPGVSLVDIHTHTGANDPDGFSLSVEALLATLDAAGSRAAVMTMQEPDGYRAANDRILAEAAGSDGRLMPFCRVGPADNPEGEVARCLEAGARGIKLHPRAEGFQLSDRGVEPLFAVAHERRLPIVIHAGRGIPTLGRDALELARRYPDAPIVLAHAAICDLNWLSRDIRGCPNLFLDTSWWNPLDLAALIALVPPGQILYGSDLPYFTPFMVSTIVTRYAFQAGLDERQVAMILGGQAERLLAGMEPIDLGPPPGDGNYRADVRLQRLTGLLILAIGRMLMGRTGWEPLSLSRLACDLGDPSAPESEVCRNVLALLEAQEQFAKMHPDDGRPLAPGIRLVMLAASLPGTPDVALPRIPELESVEDLRRSTSAGHRIIPPAERDASESAQPASPSRGSSAADHRVIEVEAAAPPAEAGDAAGS